MVFKKSLGHSPFLYIFLQSCMIVSVVSVFRLSIISVVIPSHPAAFLVFISFIAALISTSIISGLMLLTLVSFLLSIFMIFGFSSLVYNSSIYSFHLHLISSGSVRRAPFLFLILGFVFWLLLLSVSYFIFSYIKSDLPFLSISSNSEHCSSHHFSCFNCCTS